MYSSKGLLHQCISAGIILCYVLTIALVVIGCTRDHLALVGPKIAVVTKPSTSTTVCPCTTTPGSSTTTPGSTTVTPPVQVPAVDTLPIPPPHFSPDGGTFHMSTQVQLTADTLPTGAVIEFSVDNGENWRAGQQFTLNLGGNILTRIRVGANVSRSRRSALFNLYFERMLIIGNSIMNHGPVPDLGWFNNNGMAASAPEKDFVHLLTGRLQAIYSPITVKLQSGGDFERQYGTAEYNLNEFNETLQTFKPDLILVRIGENIDQSQVTKRDFDAQYRQFLDRLANYGQPVRIVCTTSVWDQPQSDRIIRKVTTEKGHALVDLGCMVGQGQYFASQYANSGVAAHPNDTGMQRIADLIWAKIQ
jgi:hypothetical protein